MDGDQNKYVLVTGGAGYIGSHTVIELINDGYTPVVVDNCVTSDKIPECIKRVEKITGTKIIFKGVDLMEKEELHKIFQQYHFLAVFHFAGLKSVTESIQQPIQYYEINLGIAVNLIECMSELGVKNMIFSSSATVYGPPNSLPVDESHVVGEGLTNPYGKTKFFIEEIFRDLAKAEKDWKIVLLRYFNPVGCHPSGLIGEDPEGLPNNLMPYVSQVAIGRLPFLNVYGNDYDTPDGTGVRDFIHVTDLAKGHTAALKNIDSVNGCEAFNLGTGKGYSVLEAVKALEKASGEKVAYKFAPRRPGDLGNVYADASLAEKRFQWKASLSLDDMCRDLWRWQSMNPKGYKSSI